MLGDDFMKRFNLKSFLWGIIVASICITTVLAARQIKLAKFSNAEIILDNSIIQLKNPLVVIGRGWKKDSQLYIPIEELLGHLGYMVNWNSNDNTVNLTNTNIEDKNIRVYDHGIGENGKFITNEDYYNLNEGEVLVFNLYRINDGNMVDGVYKERQDLDLKIQIKNPTGTIESEIVINLNDPQKSIVVKEDGQYQVILSNPKADTALMFELSVEKQSK